MARKNLPSVPSYLAAQTKINQSLVDGVGGIQFTVQSPPGVGRLIRIPFYLTNATAGFAALTSTGDTAANVTAALAAGGIASSSDPLIVAAPPLRRVLASPPTSSPRRSRGRRFVSSASRPRCSGPRCLRLRSPSWASRI